MDFILHPDHYLEALGPLGMFVSMAIIFAESGLFLAFFLPRRYLTFDGGLARLQGNL